MVYKERNLIIATYIDALNGKHSDDNIMIDASKNINNYVKDLIQDGMISIDFAYKTLELCLDENHEFSWFIYLFTDSEYPIESGVYSKEVSGLTGSEKDYDILEKLIIEILKAKNFSL